MALVENLRTRVMHNKIIKNKKIKTSHRWRYRAGSKRGCPKLTAHKQ